jgi:DNA primase
MSSSEEIADIKNKIDIVDLIGHYVTLKKTGANFKGVCPFHHEKTPSFMVNPERQSFKCFGCDKGGDIFTFIQEAESIEFGDALKMLADRAGVVLTPLSKPRQGEAPSEKSRYYAINSTAANLFHTLLTEHKVGEQARLYLKKRGITEATIKKWQIGYVPRRKVLAEILLKRGFTEQEIQRAGKPDMFYDRIMFPIQDVMGNVVGFTGRILGEGEPKYLNTPETVIFRKSRILFGLEKAKQAIKTSGAVIITEGQMDVISASQAGTHNVVATSGTALTQDHLRILSRYGVDIIFAFDADGAGVAATKRAIDLAIVDDLPVKVIPLPPPHKDIGDMVEQNPKGWLELAKKPIPAVEWHIQSVLSKFIVAGIERKLSVDEKKQVAKELVPVLNRIPDTIEQAHYMQVLAKRLEVKEETIQQAMSRAKKPSGQLTSSLVNQSTSRRALSTEETLLGLLDRSKDLQSQHSDLYNELKLWYNKPTNDLIFSVEEQYRGLTVAQLRAEIELLIKRYQEDKKDKIKNEFATKISQAETSGDRELVKKLLAEFQQLIKT